MYKWDGLHLEVLHQIHIIEDGKIALVYHWFSHFWPQDLWIIILIIQSNNFLYHSKVKCIVSQFATCLMGNIRIQTCAKPNKQSLLLWSAI